MPPDTLLAFVKCCLDIDDETIRNFKGPAPITAEVYSAGWDRFAIDRDLYAKRQILEAYEDVVAALERLDADPPDDATMLDLWVARARVQQAAVAFRAIAATYKDRHGYTMAARGESVVTS